MKQYINSKTNEIIETISVMAGDWKLFDGETKKEANSQSGPIIDPEVPQQEVPKTEQAPVQEPAENTEDFDGITIAQIKQELDAFGVEYNPKDKKQVLYDLMMQHGK